jgi:nucleoside-diphosphate-sugar epimerase
MVIPARERAPRDPHESFYWLQEDYLIAKAHEHGFAYTVLRPQLVFGRPWGVAMNLIPVLGAYAAIRQELGQPFSYFGGDLTYVREAADSRLVAEALEWAATSPLAVNETFNVTNGDVYEWRNVWPALADALSVEAGPDEPQLMAEFFEDKETIWDRIVEKHHLRQIALPQILGYSHHLADWNFMYGVEERAPQFVSRIKLMKAGFQGCQDTEEMFRYWLHDLIRRRVLPGPLE